MSQKDTSGIIRQYLQLCRNPLRGEDKVTHEYTQLIQHPRVVNVGFFRPDVLMVGTDQIVIKYGGKKYLIGEFIIFLIRRKVGCYWEVDFRFWNVTHPVWLEGDHENPPEVLYIHPHILVTNDDLLDAPNGSLCISKGQFGVYQHMRKGEMHLVVPRLIEILETYPTGKAYFDADKWPVLGGDNA